MKKALALIAMLTLGIVPAYATDDKPDCHGANEEECREDPSDSGQDCDPHGRNEDGNDDHCAATTTTAPATTTTAPAATTTTVPATTTTAAPATTTTVDGAITPAGPAPSLATEVQGITETRPEALPQTGRSTDLAALGMFAGLLGLLCAYAGRPRQL